MRGQNPEITTVRRIAEAALLVAIFTAMAFQYIRFEVFETEKNALLGLLALVILGANLFEFVQLRRFPKVQNPVIYAVFAFILAGFVSTVFSLSPSYSFWGSPTRGHGLVMLMIYGALFWQAVRSYRRLQEALFPIIAMTSIPMCVWAIQSYYAQDSGVFRPASTAGNPNYLAGWITMFLVYFGAQIYWKIVSWERPFSRVRYTQLAVYISIFLLNLATFVILSSRGAFGGFAFAVIASIAIYISFLKKRTLLTAALVLFVIGAGAYLAISRSYAGKNPDQIGFARIFVPYDESRDVLWQTAITMMEQQSKPFIDANGNKDRWAFLRPAIGYGPETLEQTQNRFEEPFTSSRWQNRFVERFHNIFFDWFVEMGSLGALTIIALYQTAFYVAMRRLGLIQASQVWFWLGVQIIAVPAGILYVTTIMSQADSAGLIPLGGAVGSILGTLLWCMWRGFTPSPEESSPKFDAKTITVAAIFAIIAGQWIDNQFGFMQIMSQTIFFIFLGMLVGLSSTSEEVEVYAEDEEPEAIPESSYWLAGTLISGLFIVYGFGKAMESSFTQAAIGTNEYPFFLAIVLIMGAALAFLSKETETDPAPQQEVPKARGKRGKAPQKRASQKPQPLYMSLIYIVIAWAVFFGFKSFLVQSAGQTLQSSLTNPVGPSVGGIQSTYVTLAMNGVMLMIVSLVVLFWIVKAHQNISLIGMGTLIVAIFLMGGAVFYVRNFTISTMRAVADGFTTVRDKNGNLMLQPLFAANLIYERAASTWPGDVKLRLNRVDSLITQLGVTQDANRQQTLFAEIQKEHDNALKPAPFFVNSKTWEVFVQRYNRFERSIGAAPQQQSPVQSQQLPPGVPTTSPNDLPPGIPTRAPDNLPPGFVPPTGGQQPPGNGPTNP